MMPGHCIWFGWGGGGGGGGGWGWGHVPLVNFGILEVTQIVLETIFETPSVLNRE